MAGGGMTLVAYVIGFLSGAGAMYAVLWFVQQKQVTPVSSPPVASSPAPAGNIPADDPVRERLRLLRRGHAARLHSARQSLALGYPDNAKRSEEEAGDIAREIAALERELEAETV